jgi:uncharacterized protein
MAVPTNLLRSTLLGMAVSMASCGMPPPLPESTPATHGMVRRSELEIVDCLLPGEVRQLGNMSFLTQRRPARTTASECWIRGGEYVAYDRADLASSLRIWMAAAQAGDADAQTNVAEIYERGLGVAPDYEAAAMWYQKAADQGNARALFNLGTLYEQGQGVPMDRLKALNLYRLAADIPRDSLVYLSAAAHEQEQLRQELQAAIDEKDSQLQLLRQQVNDLETKIAHRPESQPAIKARDSDQVKALWRWIAKLEGERRNSDIRLASLPRTRAPQPRIELASFRSNADERVIEGVNFGRFYAVVIGNQDYEAIEDLQTSYQDADRISRILRDKYGFNVTVLEDAEDMDILRTLNDLDAVLTPEDNLLIYYAGHGERVATATGEKGYWLPVNADAPPKDRFWVANDQITMHLARLRAKRVLVIADSCYSGLLSSDPSYLFLGGNVQYSKEYLTYKAKKRSRLLLSSGGNKPVLDQGGSNSVFAHAIANRLEVNDRTISALELFGLIREQVKIAAAANGFAQSPELKSIKGAGHEVGDFFFVPTTAPSQDLGPVASRD